MEWAKLNTLVIVIRNWQQPETDGVELKPELLQN